MQNQSQKISQLIADALAEDIGSGDVTSTATIAVAQSLTGDLLAKAEGVVAGLEIAAQVFRQLDPQVTFTAHVKDGDLVPPSTLVASVRGRGRALLSGERVALNLLQRMSGIATYTHRLATAVAHTDTKILDTRKTVPGLRLLDKLAVKLGGGVNHRFGLYDMALIKENHIVAAGGIATAVAAVRSLNAAVPIEVEVTNLVELTQALSVNVDRIMLDNMSLAEMRTAVELTAGRVPLEASGNVTLERAAAIAETGVDYISVGALTHSVTALDISFLIAQPLPETILGQPTTL